MFKLLILYGRGSILLRLSSNFFLETFFELTDIGFIKHLVNVDVYLLNDADRVFAY